MEYTYFSLKYRVAWNHVNYGSHFTGSLNGIIWNWEALIHDKSQIEISDVFLNLLAASNEIDGRGGHPLKTFSSKDGFSFHLRHPGTPWLRPCIILNKNFHKTNEIYAFKCYQLHRICIYAFSQRNVIQPPVVAYKIPRNASR